MNREHRIRTTSYPNPGAVAMYSIFLGSWILGPTIPFIVAALYMYNIATFPVYIVAAYFGYSALVPLKRWTVMRNIFSNGFNMGYFRSTDVVVFGPPVVANSKEMICIHPHGILCVGWMVANMSNILGSSGCGISWLATPAIFYIPFARNIFAWCGNGSVSPANMTNMMVRGENIALLPGGFGDATLYTRGRHRCYLKQRMGFIKYALRYGYSVRPCYVFGEEETYRAFNYFEKARLYLASKSIPGIIPLGKYGLLPNDEIDISVVCGEPIKFPHIPNPSSAEIVKWHTNYTKTLVELFDTNKQKYGYSADTELELE